MVIAKFVNISANQKRPLSQNTRITTNYLLLKLWPKPFSHIYHRTTTVVYNNIDLKSYLKWQFPIAGQRTPRRHFCCSIESELWLLEPTIGAVLVWIECGRTLQIWTNRSLPPWANLRRLPGYCELPSPWNFQL